MRTSRAIGTIGIALTVVLLLAACSGGDDDGPHAGALNAEEQQFADAFAADVARDAGVPVDADQGRCIGEAILHELGVRPFHDAKLEPDDLGGKSPGELLGKGRVTDQQAAAIAVAWDACADTTTQFAAQAREQIGLDEPGVACFQKRLGETNAIQRYLAINFTTDDEAEVQTVLDEIKDLVEQCARESGQAARVVDAVAASISSQGTVSGDDARCLAQHVVDALGVGNLLSIGSSNGLAAAPTDVQRSVAQGVIDAAEACSVDLAKLGSADPG